MRRRRKERGGWRNAIYSWLISLRLLMSSATPAKQCVSLYVFWLEALLWLFFFFIQKNRAQRHACMLCYPRYTTVATPFESHLVHVQNVFHACPLHWLLFYSSQISSFTFVSLSSQVWIITGRRCLSTARGYSCISSSPSPATTISRSSPLSCY